MSSEYQVKMDQAEVCEQIIVRFRANDDSVGHPGRLNFAAKTQREWLELVTAYQEALEIYRDFNQREKAKSLLENLLDFVQTCDEFTSSLALQLLIALESSHRWLEQTVPGSKEQIKTAFRVTISQKLLQKEMEYWLLLRALNVLRDIANDEQEQKTIDISLCQTMELGAQVSYRRGNLDNAEGWYRDAARMAQDRVGNTEWASHLLQTADSIRQIRLSRSTSANIQETSVADVPSKSEIVNDTAQQMSIADRLGLILQRTAWKQHSQRFLPPAEEFIADYASEEDKLSKLINDDRLLLDKSQIEEREASFRGQGLLGWLQGVFVDAQGNPRGEFDATSRFTVQFITEITEIIEALFLVWQEQGDLTEEQIKQFLSGNGAYYNWDIYHAGLSRHFELDFICSTHTLVPQFENIVRTSAQATGIDIKKFKKGVPGDILLNDLINPSNVEMQDLLGEGLFDLIYWYFVNSNCPFSYRHKIAHGWILPEECSLQLSAMVIWLTLKVLNASSEASNL